MAINWCCSIPQVVVTFDQLRAIFLSARNVQRKQEAKKAAALVHQAKKPQKHAATAKEEAEEQATKDAAVAMAKRR